MPPARARNEYFLFGQQSVRTALQPVPVRGLIFIKVKTQTGGRARPRIWHPDQANLPPPVNDLRKVFPSAGPSCPARDFRAA
jgi:hypothetical protein